MALGTDDRKALHAGLLDLIAALNGQASRYVSDSAAFLRYRQDQDRGRLGGLENKLIDQQRHIQLLDRLVEQQATIIELLEERVVRLEELRERAVGE